MQCIHGVLAVDWGWAQARSLKGWRAELIACSTQARLLRASELRGNGSSPKAPQIELGLSVFTLQLEAIY